MKASQQSKTKESLFSFKVWYLYAILALIYIILAILFNNYIQTDNFYYNSLSDKLDLPRISEIISIRHKFQIIGYISIPVVLLFKLWIIAGVIYTGLYLLQKKVSYKNCLKIALIAEFVSIVAMLIKTAWLMIDTPTNANDLQSFSALSITQLLDLDRMPNYIFYPMQLINIFEIAYWMVLTYGIMVFTKQDWARSLKTVASSYGVALFIWVIFIVLIQVQLT